MTAELGENVRAVVSGQKQYPLKTKPLWVPGLDQVAPHVEAALRENYVNVKVRRSYSCCSYNFVAHECRSL